MPSLGYLSGQEIRVYSDERLSFSGCVSYYDTAKAHCFPYFEQDGTPLYIPSRSSGLSSFLPGCMIWLVAKISLKYLPHTHNVSSTKFTHNCLECMFITTKTTYIKVMIISLKKEVYALDVLLQASEL